ncbi:uncharacterized protein BROUX77_002184 [Berkeleyomyces rouxiae]|uniref:uncharacterized protein n=1 Tax=Berkeleyomyces rouxiae TaxID=2035830 RepID=UPI003B77AB1A
MAPSLFSLLATTLAISQVSLALPSFDASSNPHSGFDTLSVSDSPRSDEQADSTEQMEDGREALASVYIKYGKPLPEDLEVAMTRRKKRDEFLATLSTTHNRALITAKIGIPEQPLRLVLDTSSSGLWLHSEHTANPDYQTAYNPGVSLTAEEMVKEWWEIEHLDSRVASGKVYYDFVSIDTIGTKIISRSQALQIADAATGFPEMPHGSGILGLAFSSINNIKPKPHPNLFDNIAERLARKVFTVDIKQSIGEADFGYIDHTGYFGDLGYSDVFNQNGFWNFTIQGLVSDFEAPTSGVEYAIADTATPMIMLPSTYVSAFYEQVEAARYSKKHGGFIMRCGVDMPDFTFRVGGVLIAIPKHHMQVPLNDNDKLCFGSLQFSDELGVNIIGISAFKAAFVVFDPINAKIGWARKYR